LKKSLWFVAIIPPEEIFGQIRSIQQEIADRFGPRRILKIPVHLTIEAPFRHENGAGTPLDFLLRDFFAAKTRFSLELRNFGSFRQDVVFIQVEPSLPLLEIQSQLGVFLRTETSTIRGEPWHGGYTPHITVANRDVTPEAHQRVWREFKTRKFYAAFDVTEIVLLRHDEKLWQVHHRFPLREFTA
jgi:2'-5' RNA ligase